MATPPTILALDFDGVVCDGRPEYFETAWRAYAAAWPNALTAARPSMISTRFSDLRPLIESGWEMPLMVHALLSGTDERTFKDRHAWLAAGKALMASGGVTSETLGRALNRVRDDWFARDAAGWVSHNKFYPGVGARLLALLDGPTKVMVVTTKAERFTRALLTAEHPRLADVQVIGREPGTSEPKPAILRRVANGAGLGPDAAGIWFVEDMLETLEATAARADVGGVRLFLVDWGYNTPEDRAHVAGVGGRITLLSLERFAGPLETW